MAFYSLGKLATSVFDRREELTVMTLAFMVPLTVLAQFVR